MVLMFWSESKYAALRSWYAQGEVLVGSGIRLEWSLNRAIIDVCGSEVRCCPPLSRSVMFRSDSVCAFLLMTEARCGGIVGIQPVRSSGMGSRSAWGVVVVGEYPYGHLGGDLDPHRVWR